MGAVSLLLLACPTNPSARSRIPAPHSSRRGKILVRAKAGSNAGHNLAVERLRSAPRRRAANFPADLPSIERRDSGWLGSLAKILGVGIAVVALAALGAHRPAFAAPAFVGEEEEQKITAPDLHSRFVEWKDGFHREMEQMGPMRKRLFEIYGLDKRFEKFRQGIEERELMYREVLGVKDMLKEIEELAGKSEARSLEVEFRVRGALVQARRKLTMGARRLQGEVLLKTSSHLAKLRKEEASLMKELNEAMDGFPGLRKKFDAAETQPAEDDLGGSTKAFSPKSESDDQVDAQESLFFSKTEELRAKIVNVKAELVGSEYEGWLRAWHEIPNFTAIFAAELEEAAKFRLPERLESRIANDLRASGKEIWEESILPLALDKQEKGVVPVDSTVKSEVDELLRRHIQFAGSDERKAVSAVDGKLGSIELYSALGGSVSDVPGPEAVKTILGWRKWCSIKKEELKQHLLDHPEAGKKYIQEQQEKLLLARDRVLQNTWYNEKSRRWEMSDAAAMYAVEKNLVHHVRIRHDLRVIFVGLKGDDQEYVVDVEDLNERLEDVGAFDAFYAMLKENKIPTVMEKMWIPLREWSAFQLIRLPFVMLIDAVLYVWNLGIVAAARDLYFESLDALLGELMVRFGYPAILKLPRLVREMIGFELPKGSEFLEPTFLMKWQTAAQAKFDARQIALPFWMDLPLRIYVVGVPLLFVVTRVAKAIYRFIGPPPLPKSQYDKAVELHMKVYKEMTPLLKQVTTNPIKRVFDKMKRIRKPPVSLNDFVGIETFREEVDEVVSFLRDPGAFKKLGARAPRGVIIVGETGTGKTTLARAIASEARVPVVELQSFDLQGGGEWVGQKAANVRELFKTARQFAPIILFMDDFDDFVGKRGETMHLDTQELETLINQMLVELDGFETQEGVVVLATTSHPERIDEALRRPGRMDRTIKLLPPNRTQREQMLRLIARNTMFPHVVDWVNWAEVAEKTEGLTYVDLEPIPVNLQQCATHWKTKDEEELFSYLCILDKYNKIVPEWIRKTPLLKKWDQSVIDWLGLRVTKEDFEMTVRYMDVRGRSKPGIEFHDPLYPWTRETKYPHAVWAAARGLLARLLPNFDIVEYIWLDETSWEGIAWTRLTRRVEEGYLETHTQTRNYLEKKLVLCYASHVACCMLMPVLDRNNLAEPQLEEAKQIAADMVMEYGWALDDSPMVYRSKGEGPMDMGLQEMTVIERKVTKLLTVACDRASQILARNKQVLEALVEQLVVHENITQEFMEKTLKEKGATFEGEPFTLQALDSSLQEQPTNGTGRLMGALVN
ncbi:probable inactive ATP-dependent zinc metalloprotease FTSHI 5, chloroplastic [Selaginella moellendorffii]|uniref:probable inactive ATP-dependent zinc metalloprotease FTSHI 5, chloroplastic n=1 Tax=Selaginella moellendorffii TaxID=88036 RepID=UPI000D1D01FA|nr:probable inactive ATP-dependent zinc metalloprotease FTSHI 5, chloroplastic [Selaginella moellendorffii]|eukprot:XP_024529282.1 probable inactive ATP-dependent zinc metalloprotease FTSHI 5, chloroplastic [Selaginella moellendorffii]